MKCQISIVFTVKSASPEWPCISSVRTHDQGGEEKNKNKPTNQDQLFHTTLGAKPKHPTNV